MLEYFWKACSAQMQENMSILSKWGKAVTEQPHFNDPLTDGAYREKVYEHGQAILYRYPASENSSKVPLLIVYALVNKPYVLDLSPQRSFIRGLSNGGMDIYLIEWKNPYHSIPKPGLEDYIQDSIHHVVKWIAGQHKLDKINIMGICQGGVFSLIYNALYPENVKNLITVVTPLDFHAGDSIFTHLVKYCDTAKISDTMEVIPGDMLNMAFLQIRPFELLVGKYLGINEIIDNPEQMDMFMRMEKWIFDSPGISGPAWHKFIQDCYKENKLVKNQMQIGGTPIDLSKISCPVLSLTAEKDNIVPPECSEPIGRVTSSKDYTHLHYPVGHIGIFVGSFANKKIIPSILQWICEHP